jgi:ADP-heptose:LPS heptosyltransferase
MKKILLESDIPDSLLPLDTNCEYFVENQQVSYFAVKTNGNLLVTNIGQNGFRNFKVDDDLNGKELVVFRAGGGGDILFLFPLLDEIKRRFPSCTLTVSCNSYYHFIATNCKSVDKVLPFPVKVKDLPEECVILGLEGAVENNDAMPSVDCMFWTAGLPLPDRETIKKSLVYTPKEEHVAKAQLIPVAKHRDRIRIGYQWSASSPVRTYPHKNSCELVTKLAEDGGFEVCLLGEPNSIEIGSKPAKGWVYNMTKEGLSWEESVAFLKSCDLVIGPDSSSIHFAGAMGVKALGLYAPFEWNLRTNYFDSVWCFQQRGDCAPCKHHSSNAYGLFPKNKPCSKSGQCEVLATLDPDRVFKKALQLLNK